MTQQIDAAGCAPAIAVGGEAPRVRGVLRISGVDTSLEVLFDRVPTDGDLRAFYDYARAFGQEGAR